MASSDSSPRRYGSREPRDRYRGSDGGRYGRNESKYDDPPHSRLFILCGKSVTEDDLRESFATYGPIEEICVVKEGVAYVKFSKTSEAALAMEEMNGKRIGGRSLKVLIAHSRDQGSRRDMNEEERLLRLFVVVPKTFEEAEIKEHFKQFGDIDHVSIVRDRDSHDSKGFAYVKYYRMSHAAKAFESCDRSYKPRFANPRPPKSDGSREPRGGGRDSLRGSDGYGGGYNSGSRTMHHNNHHSPFDAAPYRELDTGGLNPECVTPLTVIASPVLNQDQLWKLCDLIPGLDYCDLREDPTTGQGRGVATVVYKTQQSAIYAKEKLHGFEYPLGHRLIVKLGQQDMPRDDFSRHSVPVSGRDIYSMGMERARAAPPARRVSQYKVLVTGLPPTGSWQDLKDHMRVVGDVCSADVHKDGTGVVEFVRYEDMKSAVKKLDNTKFHSHEGESSTIRVKEDYGGSSPGGGGGGGRSRSRSRSPHNNRDSPMNSPVHHQSYSRSPPRGMEVQDALTL